ncbi:MAG: aldehyde:ferredoxin oxidoreductase [Thermacetogenium sp.]|nr:aldehyde:ferredoxin oxidoreductase [Thermacetogenium sp.]
MLLIGPAGENLSALACIMTDVGHAAGRTGMGAVMGSKNLKAVAVRRTDSLKREVPEAAVAAVKEYIARLKSLSCWEMWTTSGSSGWLKWTDAQGASGAKNYRQVTFEAPRMSINMGF